MHRLRRVTAAASCCADLCGVERAATEVQAAAGGCLAAGAEVS